MSSGANDPPLQPPDDLLLLDLDGDALLRVLTIVLVAKRVFPGKPTIEAGKKALRPGAGDICVVCLEDYGLESVEVYDISCGHAFHCGCLREWADKSSSCPVCRAPLPVSHGLIAEKNIGPLLDAVYEELRARIGAVEGEPGQA